MTQTVKFIRLSEIPEHERAGWSIREMPNHHGRYAAIAYKEERAAA